MIDFIIVGAGAAGIVVATRLAAAGRRVLLLEAGAAYDRPAREVPANAYDTLGTGLTWTNETVPQTRLDGRRIALFTGRGVGGGSAVNGMGWTTGFPEDYDDWEASGAVGWGWSEMRDRFRQVTRSEIGHGGGADTRGFIPVSHPHHIHPSTPAFLAAARALGHIPTDDFNGQQREGVGLLASNIEDGGRADVVSEVLLPAMDSHDIELRSDAAVDSLLAVGSRVVGVRLASGVEERARHVVLAAGPIRTPALLLRSGIGDAETLAGLSIPLLQHLPGVGANLHDHPKVAIAFAGDTSRETLGALYDDPTTTWKTTHRGPLAALGQGAIVMRSPGADRPDLHVFLSPLGRGQGRPEDALQGILCSVALVAPRSRGRVELDPDDHASLWIDPSYLDHPEDRRRLRAGLRHATKLIRDPGLERLLGTAREMPGGTDDAIDAFTAANTDSYWHPAGTARMGSDPDSVVGPDLGVHGVEGLSVVDSSVFPASPRAHTQAATIATASRASDLLSSRIGSR